MTRRRPNPRRAGSNRRRPDCADFHRCPGLDDAVAARRRSSTWRVECERRRANRSGLEAIAAGAALPLEWFGSRRHGFIAAGSRSEGGALLDRFFPRPAIGAEGPPGRAKGAPGRRRPRARVCPQAHVVLGDCRAPRAPRRRREVDPEPERVCFERRGLRRVRAEAWHGGACRWRWARTPARSVGIRTEGHDGALRGPLGAQAYAPASRRPAGVRVETRVDPLAQGRTELGCQRTSNSIRAGRGAFPGWPALCGRLGRTHKRPAHSLAHLAGMRLRGSPAPVAGGEAAARHVRIGLGTACGQHRRGMKATALTVRGV